MSLLCSSLQLEELKVIYLYDEFYTVQSFKAAYADNITAMTGNMQWVSIDPRFKIHPSVQRPL